MSQEPKQRRSKHFNPIPVGPYSFSEGSIQQSTWAGAPAAGATARLGAFLERSLAPARAERKLH